MNLLKSIIVKRFAAFSLAIGSVGFGVSQAKADDFGLQSSVAAVEGRQLRSADDLQQLVGPIALYPDALLAQVFVASTYPGDVLAAAQFLQNGGDPARADAYGWDASVLGLLQTPDVLNQLAGDVDWMNQVGDAFLAQQQDVFDAVQSLRAQAQAAGNLESNAQAQVFSSGGCIQIIPADPQVIYVPRYDPRIVYVVRERRFYDEPCVTFGFGVRVGVWLHEDCDWQEHRIYVGDWGGDRPWWHNEGRIDRIDYVRNRPGVFVNNVTNVTNINNVTNVRSSSQWQRNSNKPAPQRLPGPVVTPRTQTTNGPTRVTPPTRTTNGPTRVTPPTRTTNGPTRVTPPTRTTNGPTRVTPPTRTTNGPTRVTPPTRTTNGPTHVTPPTRTASGPTHVTPPTRTASGPTHVTPPTRTASAPTHVTPPTRTASVPTHVATPARTTSVPTHVTPPTRTASVATHVATPARTTSAPTHVTPPTRTASVPTHVATPARTTSVPTHMTPPTRTASVATHVASPARTPVAPPHVPTSTRTASATHVTSPTVRPASVPAARPALARPATPVAAHSVPAQSTPAPVALATAHNGHTR